MNHSELADLLAQTHSGTSHQHSSAYAQLPSNSPLSPRQRFQCQIRTLSDDGSPTTTPRSSPHRANHELQQIASLRVQSSSPRGLGRRPKQSKSIDIAPDFGLEERAAWNRHSPRSTPDRPKDHGQELNQDYVLHSPEKDADSVVPSPSVASPLKEFRPLQEIVHTRERPKTSRGSKPSLTGHLEYTEQQKRKSKFLEGSMNDRSVGVSSLWNESASITGTDTDSDITPRASEVSRTSRSSIDFSDFKPQPFTPATIKKRFSKLAHSFRSGEDKHKAIDEEQESPRKSLRKTKSTWSFKIFGNSTHDVSEEKASPKKAKDEELAVLDERKRKAEEAYGRQFGFKRQKSNSGLASMLSPTKTETKSGAIRRRSVSGGHTITAGTNTRRRRVSSAETITRLQDPAELVNNNDIDHQKLPSRQELEKENQQLRAMLREQQKRQPGSTSTAELSTTVASAHLSIPKPYTHQTYSWSIESNSPVKQFPDPTKNIPPLPAHPKRTVLGNLSNARGHNNVNDVGTMKHVRKSSRPVPVIPEEDEGNENKKPVPSQKVLVAPIKQGEKWEWPEDVF